MLSNLCCKLDVRTSTTAETLEQPVTTTHIHTRAMSSAQTLSPGARRSRRLSLAPDAGVAAATDANPFKKARITRRTFGSAVEVPIILDSSDDEDDDDADGSRYSLSSNADVDHLDRAIVKIAKTNSLNDVVSISSPSARSKQRQREKQRQKEKEKQKQPTKLKLKIKSDLKAKPKSSPKQDSKQKRAPPKTASKPTAANSPKSKPATSSNSSAASATTKSKPASTSTSTSKLADSAKSSEKQSQPSSKDNWHFHPASRASRRALLEANANRTSSTSSANHISISSVSPLVDDGTSTKENKESRIEHSKLSPSDEKKVVLKEKETPKPSTKPPNSPKVAKAPISAFAAISASAKANAPAIETLSSIPNKPVKKVTIQDLTRKVSLHNSAKTEGKAAQGTLKIGGKTEEQIQQEMRETRAKIQERVNKSKEKSEQKQKQKEKEKVKEITGAPLDTPVFDPSIHKPYRNIYSESCINCSKKGRGEYCNRQQPCDICVGKRIRNCTFSSTAQVAIPARPSAKNSGASGTGKSGDATRKHISNGKRLAQSISSTTSSVEDGDEDDEDDGVIVSSRKRLSEKKSKRAARKLVEDDDDDSEQSSSDSDDADDGDEDEDDDGLSGESETQSDDDTDISDSEDESVHEDSFDDDKSEDSPKKESRKSDRKRDSRHSISPSDNFEKAQRILKELEFEKRDVDVYTTGRRRRAATETRGDYRIPSDNEDPETNGYAAAEARDEQIILSEDEEQRRLMRGELDAEYLETLRKEREKKMMALSYESESEEDEMFFR